uniref:Lysosomal acid phosphatase n=1 Tax=Acrobeloides nanus TaxID=290746 RepID=A0A914DPJ1_9BILA
MQILCWVHILFGINQVFTQHLANKKADLDTLRLVHAIWRHGDRTPSVLIPTDVNNTEETWEIGLGELTKLGLQQEFRLGRFLRERYDGFLSKKYSPFEIYVRSSDYNRTLASAQANMAGLFSPTDEEIFMPDLKWRPIPVHTIPKYLDRLFYDKILCPNAEAELNRVYEEDAKVKQIERENANMLRYLGEKSGLGKIPIPLKDMWNLFDPLNSIASHPEDHDLPSWVNQTIKDEIWRLYDLCCTFLYSTNILARLRAGPLFAEVLNRMKSKVQNTLDSREKFYAYSSHDTSVAGILAGFGIFPEIFPLYATLVLVEMHQKDSQNIVRIFYKNETDQPKMFEYEIPGCKTPCTLEKLEEVRKHVIPLNWESECGLVNWYDIEADTYLYIIVILSLVCILLTLQMVNMTLANRRFHKALKGGYKSQSRRRLLDVEEEDPYPE